MNSLFFRAVASVAALVVVLASAPQSAAQPAAGSVSAGNINVVQNDALNNATSVTVTLGSNVAGSAGVFALRAGSSRGDFNVQIGSTATTNFVNGVLLSAVRQNGRDNSAFGDTTTGPQYSTSAVETDGNGGLFIPVHNAIVANSVEFNVNVAAAYFPYASGWVGGHARNTANGGAIGTASSSFAPGVALGTQFVEPATPNGTFTVNLAGVTGITSPLPSQGGVLLVNGGKNEDNYALSRANADGTFTIFNRDNGSDAGTAPTFNSEQDGVAFVYVPANTAGVTSGRVIGEGATLALVANVGSIGAGLATVTDGGDGTVFLSIAGVTSDTDGVLVISNEGGDTSNVDNIVSYEWDDANDRFVIQTRDLPGLTLQDMGAAEGIFSFAFIPTPVPEPATVFGACAAALAAGATLRRRRAAVTA